MHYAILLIVFLFMFPQSALSQSPTSVVNTDEIQKIREVVQQKVKEKLMEITATTPTKRGVIGKLIAIDSKQLTIEYRGQTQAIELNEDTVFIDEKRNRSTFDKIKIGQDLLVMGTNQPESSSFLAKRAVFVKLDEIEPIRVVSLGKVSDISKTTSILSLVPVSNKNTQYQIRTDSKTIFTNPADQKTEASSIKVGHTIIAVLTPDAKQSKTYYASRIIHLSPTASSPTPTL